MKWITRERPKTDRIACPWLIKRFIDEYKLGSNRALVRLAKIVHAADISEDLETDPLGAGLLAIGIGGLSVESNDQRLLEKGELLYDALYAWCLR